MRSNDLLNLKANMNSLGLTLPADVEKYESIQQKLASLPKHEGKRNLDGVNSAKDVAAEIEKRALDAVLAKERANQAQLMSDAATRSIDSTLIRETETIIDDLRPIVFKAHQTIMNAHAKMNGSLTADAAIAFDASKDYKAANAAWTVIDTAATIRAKLHTLDTPDLERGTQRALTFWRFTNLQAWKAYDALPDAGSGAANHALSAQTEGVEFAWLSTDDAEAQSHALGRMQAAERKGEDEANAVWDADHQAFRTGANAWMHM